MVHSRPERAQDAVFITAIIIGCAVLLLMLIT
jgi:hypothetical protein